MADKAVFAVNYGVAGLLAEPMNLAAEEALRTGARPCEKRGGGDRLGGFARSMSSDGVR